MTIEDPKSPNQEISRTENRSSLVRLGILLIFLGVLAGSVILVIDIRSEGGFFYWCYYMTLGASLSLAYPILLKLNKDLLRRKRKWIAFTESLLCGGVIWLLPDLVEEAISVNWRFYDFFHKPLVNMLFTWPDLLSSIHFYGITYSDISFSLGLSLIYGFAIYFQHRVEILPLRWLRSQKLPMLIKPIIGVVFLYLAQVTLWMVFQMAAWPFVLMRIEKFTPGIFFRLGLLVSLIVGLSSSLTHSLLALKSVDITPPHGNFERNKRD